MSKRIIHASMVALIDRKLKGNREAEIAVARADARTLFYCVMISLEGIREKGGNNRGYEVELIQSTIGTAEREAWCMSTVQTAIAYVELKLKVVSPIAVSEHCLTVWRESPVSSRVKIFPLAGAIIIWQHGKSSDGHTGMFKEAVDPVQGAGGHLSFKNMLTTEGNAEKGLSGGSIVREGGGIYAAKRSMIADGTMHVIGFMRPFA